VDFKNKNYLKNYIFAGNLDKINKEQYDQSLKTASEIAKYLLGCSLIVKDEVFIISMVELYYGSAGDKYHDWFRNHYIYKCSKYRIRSEVQTKKGLRTYLSLKNVENSYCRMDIVIGPKNVAVSVLIRNVINSKGKLVGKPNGNPNIILKDMKITNEDHDKEIIIIQNKIQIDSKSIYLLDSRADFFNKNKNIKVIENHRIKLKRNNSISDFEKENNLKWNYKIEGNNFEV
jgi:hypothetical protein